MDATDGGGMAEAPEHLTDHDLPVVDRKEALGGEGHRLQDAFPAPRAGFAVVVEHPEAPRRSRSSSRCIGVREPGLNRQWSGTGGHRPWPRTTPAPTLHEISD